MKLDIQTNPNTGGLYCFFKHGGKEYFADLSVLHYHYEPQTECMIFAAKDGKVTSWSDLYCKCWLAVTDENLTACVEEFICDYIDSKNKRNY